VQKATIAAHADDIAASGLEATATCITFSLRQSIPDELVTKLALTLRKELDSCVPLTVHADARRKCLRFTEQAISQRARTIA
jgi:hypothetical protein